MVFVKNLLRGDLRPLKEVFLNLLEACLDTNLHPIVLLFEGDFLVCNNLVSGFVDLLDHELGLVLAAVVESEPFLFQVTDCAVQLGHEGARWLLHKLDCV